MAEYNSLVLEMEEYINEGKQFLLTITKTEPTHCSICDDKKNAVPDVK